MAALARTNAYNAVVLTIHQLSKSYGARTVFSNVSLQLQAGQFIAIMGESGVGKSTLLNIIAGLDTADSGQVLIISNGQDQDILTMDDDARTVLRRTQFGFVFQAFHILPHLSVAQNIGLTLALNGQSSTQLAHEWCERMGLQGRQDDMPATLSGGQLQRVAVARALIHQPKLVLADEPTGNLDPESAKQVLTLLRQQVQQANAGCILVTHSLLAAQTADAIYDLTPQGLHRRT